VLAAHGVGEDTVDVDDDCPPWFDRTVAPGPVLGCLQGAG
jgi:hypothetical protein